MSRRQITVNGKEYKYSIGKTHVKIDGVGSFLKSEIGELIPGREGSWCGFGYDHCPHCYEKIEYKESDYRVTPKDVARKIKIYT